MSTMDSPVHVKLWHREFWLLLMANLLLTCSVYIQIPVFPTWMLGEGFSLKQTGIVMGAFAVGLFLPGPFCSYLVQRYRRNWVCMLAISAMAAAYCLLFYQEEINYKVLAVQRLFIGATFGLAQMVLSSTLIIDTCESSKRTEANHYASWFGRMSLALGPLAGLIVYQRRGFEDVLMLSILAAAVAVLFILLVNFPFRTPEERVTIVSNDRFFLTKGAPLFLWLICFSTSVGMLLAAPLQQSFYLMMGVGLLIAMLARYLIFKDAELQSEVITGLILIISALLLLHFRSYVQTVHYLAPLFIGFGAGIIGSRILLFFIKLSKHCQRGTSQSTFMLAWESGIALGIGLGYYVLWGSLQPIVKLALPLSVVVLIAYIGYVHRWIITHKTR